MSKTHLTEQKFSDFALHPKVVEALEKKGFHNCTPIQALALPLTLAGRDVAGQAQTGTGKTMAFLTSTFHYLLSHPAIADRKVNQPRALIMAPTRELAVQIHADAEPLAEATGLKLGLAYGGDGYDKQLKVLESGVDILIGTTGRLIDYAKQNHINLGAIQVVACTIWALLKISAGCSAVCRLQTSASTCCSPPRFRTGYVNWRSSR